MENCRTAGDRVVQRQVLYLGENNDNQKASWCKTIEVFQEGKAQPKQIAVFPAGRAVPILGYCDIVQVKLNELQLHRPDNGVPAG